MKEPLKFDKKATLGVSAVAAVVVTTLLLKYGANSAAQNTGGAAAGTTATNAPASTTATNAEVAIDLAPTQLNAIKIEPVGSYAFPLDKDAIGSIDFDEDLSVQVFPAYQGKLLKTFAQLGDDVQKGQPLYTIDSPDLVQAESTLIGAAATYELTSKELARAKTLYSTNFGVSQREMEQAVNDQQTAEGAFKAARGAVRVFGKTEAEIDQIVATRTIDPALVVVSPVSGRVTAKVAPPGLLVQPGNSPAPYTVADLSAKWMLGNVTESDSPLFRLGQPVEVTVMAYPGRVFKGKIDKIYATVDPNTHRVMTRSVIADPNNELKSGMLANFVIRVQEPVVGTAIPFNGVVRNGDATLVSWVTTDRHHFVQRFVKVGLQRDGRYQILEGLQPGDLAVTDGAVFISNMLQAPPADD